MTEPLAPAATDLSDAQPEPIGAVAVTPQLGGVGYVERLDYEGKQLLVIGTAHVSQRSVEQVTELIETERPDVVCVELDELRHKAITGDSGWRKLDVFQVIRQQKVLFLMANIALSTFQKRIGERFGVKPGAEMLAAIRAAERIGAKVVLADRDVQATLRRTWHNLGFWSRIQLGNVLVRAPFEAVEISEEYIEALKDRDTIGEQLDAFAGIFPEIRLPLIDERDLYLMSSSREADGKKIVVVVGAAHVAGMVRNLNTVVDRAALSKIPAPTIWAQLWSWALPTVIVVGFAVGLWRSAGAGFQSLALGFALPGMIMTALLTLVAGGHPLSALIGFLGAPIAAIHPAITAGMFSGLTEAWLRRPTVEDCEAVPEAVQSVRGIYGNRFTRAMLVVILSSVGAGLGNMLGIGRLIAAMIG